MITRTLHSTLLESLDSFAAVVLLGPRQVGKTTLALSIAENRPSVYLDLEDPDELNKLNDPKFYFEHHQDKLIILDEVQRKPELFQLLRGQIDRNRREGRRFGQFLLLGSASKKLLSQRSESLAGRASYFDLQPLSLQEVGATEINELWVQGGFPEVCLFPENGFFWKKNFIKTYLERDIPTLGSRIPAETLRRFWMMLAHNQGQLFNASQLGSGLGVKGQTIGRYLDLMVDLFLIRRLSPWHTNVGKRLIKSPKTYVRDSGILHALLGISSMEELLGHPVSGGSWEGFVIENLLRAAPIFTEAYFYRTSAGAEIDLLLQFGSELWAIEIKRTTAPKLQKGFYNACEDVQPTRKWIVYSGKSEYSLSPNLKVVPLITLMEELAQAGLSVP